MRERIARFMQGRYGTDDLSKFILYLNLVIIIVNLFVKNNVLIIIELVIFFIYFFRVFSRNYSARSRENQKYLSIKEKIFGKFGKKNGSGNSYNRQYNGNSYQQRNSTYNSANAGYKIYKCPRCGQKIRVPGGKGKIEISCPKCQKRFIKRT